MIKKLSIKFHGTVTYVPSEILLMSKCVYIAEPGDHLVIDKINYMGEETFIVLRKNGEVDSGPLNLISLNTMRNLDYRECSVEKYFKLRAFL